MDRLERLSVRITDPEVRLFTGVFPRSKGQPSSQVLWWRPLTPRAVLIGVEEDLEALREPLVRQESGSHRASARCLVRLRADLHRLAMRKPTGECASHA